MEFLNPERPRLPNGKPCWLTAPGIALPDVQVRPEGRDPSGVRQWRIVIMVGGLSASHWAKEVLVDWPRLGAFFDLWWHDPEETALEFFGEVPQAQARAAEPAQVAKATAEDLGL